jgi:hypothetical protein
MAGAQTYPNSAAQVSRDLEVGCSTSIWVSVQRCNKTRTENRLQRHNGFYCSEG